MDFVYRKVVLYSCLLFLVGVWRSYGQAPAQPQPQPPAQPKVEQPAPPQPPQPPPPPPAARQTAAPEGPESGDGLASFGVFYWLAPSHPVMHNGRAATVGANPADLTYPGHSKPAPGVMISLPAGNHHTLRLSYFRAQGQGNTTVPKDVNIFSTDYSQGDYLSVGYTLQNAKISLDFLSWPFPLNNARFRVKTLWEVQYTTIKTAIDAPLKPTTDSEGNSVPTTATGSNWFIFPSLGMGVEYILTKHFRWEAKASGFLLPHRSDIWDADTFGAFKSGQFEIVFGAKAFHFKTSPQRAEFVGSTLSGGYVGLRWYPK